MSKTQTDPSARDYNCNFTTQLHWKFKYYNVNLTLAKDNGFSGFGLQSRFFVTGEIRRIQG